MISSNGDRFCKNPYFLHSLCTHNGPTRSSYGDSNYKTISEFTQARGFKRNRNSKHQL